MNCQREATKATGAKSKEGKGLDIQSSDVTIRGGERKETEDKTSSEDDIRDRYIESCGNFPLVRVNDGRDAREDQEEENLFEHDEIQGHRRHVAEIKRKGGLRASEGRR